MWRRNMKKQMISLILVICLSLQFTVPVSAHRKNLSAFTKESIPCYSDSYGSERIDSVPKYTGMDVKDETGSYYLVEYLPTLNDFLFLYILYLYYDFFLLLHF